MSSRVKFFIGHLAVSCIFALLIILWVFLIWYSSPLAQAVGVTHIFMMMLIIDVILGPLLGFVVYNEKKKTLKFDLSIIILIQLLALGYGLFNITQARPVWIVFNEDKLIQANAVMKEDFAKAKSNFQSIPWFQPQYVGAKPSLNKDERSSNTFDFMLSGISIAQRPERYVELNKAKKQMQQREQKLELLQQYNNKTDVEKILAKYPQATAFLPMKASVVDMTVLIDQKANVVKIVDLRPWH